MLDTLLGKRLSGVAEQGYKWRIIMKRKTLRWAERAAVVIIGAVIGLIFYFLLSRLF
jgi:hypothetical protein